MRRRTFTLTGSWGFFVVTEEGPPARPARETLGALSRGTVARLVDVRTGAARAESTHALWSAHDFAVFSAVLTLSYLVYYLNWVEAALVGLIVVSVAALAGHAGAVILAWNGRQLGSALVAVSTSTIQILTAVRILGWESGLHLFLISGGVLVFVIFTERQAPWRWLFIIVATVTFIVCQTILSPEGERPIPVESLSIMFSINAVLTAVLVFALAGLSYQRTNQAKAAAARSAATAENLANIDVLTGLSNRRPVIEALEAQSRTGGYVVAIADLDHFKVLNDTFGHQCGDRVLVTIAGGFRGRLRATDAVGRWGGEEFIVVLPHTSLEQAVALMEGLREGVAAAEIDCVGHTHRVTISIGVADGDDDGMSHHVVKRADDALYDAKVAGRNAVRSRGLDASPTAAPRQENLSAARIRRHGNIADA